MSLSSFPTELVEHIAAYLDLTSFRSIRLASSSLNHQLLYLFRDHFFRTRTVQWTKIGLDSLVDVTNHDIFGAGLQRLIVDSTPRHSISLWKLRKRISETNSIFSDQSGVFFKSELQARYIADEREATDLASFFNETRHDQRCLQAVFARVRVLESLIFEYEGMDKKYGKFGRRYCESSQHEMSRPFVSVLAALAASGAHVRTISVHESNNHGAVSIGRLESLAPSLRHFDTAFEKLETLQLNLRDWRDPNSGFELESDRAPFVVRFLAKAHNLRHLDLSCYSSLDDNIFGEMARHCVFSQLETCKLSLFHWQDASDLLKFLEPSSSTLKSLTLCHIALRDENRTWIDVLRQLAASEEGLQGLDKLELNYLYTKDGSRLRLGAPGHPCSTRLTVPREGSHNRWRQDLLSSIDGVFEGVPGLAQHLTAVTYPFMGIKTRWSVSEGLE